MRYVATVLAFILTALHPNASASQAPFPPESVDAASRCVEEYGPVYQTGVNVTMDQAVLQIAVNFMCATAHVSELESSRMIADCALPKLFLGMRTADYVNIDAICREGRDSERVSSYFFVGVCMMKAMEDERIFDQESALAESARCEEIAVPAVSDPNYQWHPDLGR